MSTFHPSLQLAALGLLVCFGYFVFQACYPIWPGGALLGAAFGGLCLLMDLAMVASEIARRFQAQPDYEKSLRRASHGAAWMVLAICAAWWTVGSFFRIPAVLWRDGWPLMLMFGSPFIYGAARFGAGVAECWYFPFWPMMVMRALVKIGVGIALWIELPPMAIWHPVTWQSKTMLAAWVTLSVWLTVTGTIRLFFVSGVPSALMWVIAAHRIRRMKKRLASDPAYGNADFAEISETRIKLKK